MSGFFFTKKIYQHTVCLNFTESSPSTSNELGQVPNISFLLDYLLGNEKTKRSIFDLEDDKTRIDLLDLDPDLDLHWNGIITEGFL